MTSLRSTIYNISTDIQDNTQELVAIGLAITILAVAVFLSAVS